MNIDLIPNGAIKRVHVSQNDVGRTLTFELFNNSARYNIPSGAVIKIQGTKPSGFGFSETCSVNGNVVTVDTTSGMTDEHGYIDTELQIKYNGNTIGTSNFVLAIEKNPHPDTTTDGSMETIIPELTLLVNEVKGYAEEIEGTYHAYGSPWVASTVAQMTDTDKIYVYTGSETGYTNGNWYYYDGTSWVSGGVYNAVAVNIDDTLTVQGACADAKAVGDRLEGIEALRNSETTNVSLLFSRVADNKNGASTSSGVMTIPSGSTGNTAYVGVRCQGTDFTSIKGKTVSVICPFTVSENLSDKVSANILINGTGYTINSSAWENGELTANVTINENATSTYLVASLKVTKTSPLESNGTITVGTWSASYLVQETYLEAIDRIASASAENVLTDEMLTDMTTLNLFDKSNAILTGMYNTSGTFIANNYQYSTGLIPIGDYTVFAMNRDTSTVPTWTLWKSDGVTFVRGIEARSITIDSSTDSEAVYVRSSFLATELDSVMIIPNAHPCMSEYFAHNSPRKAIKGQWVSKHLVTIGDSLTQMGYWQEMTAQMLGMTYEVSAQSGGNMTAIAGFVDSITQADVMTVWAGTNDWYGGVSLGTLLSTDRNTYYGALRHVCEEVATNLPSCKLLFITPLQRNTSNTSTWSEDSRGFKKNPNTNLTLEDFANAVLATAEIYGIPVLDMFHSGGVNAINIDAWTSDGLHPNKSQFEKLAWKIIGKLTDM